MLLCVAVEFFPLEQIHLLDVLGIENASFPEPWTEGMFAREIALPISHFFVAMNESRIIGYCVYWHICDEAHIVNIAVHPAHRSQGIGRQLLDYLLADVKKRDICRAILEVRKSNVKAQHLYNSAGFKGTGVRPRYYNNTEDAVLMELVIEHEYTKDI